MSPRSTIAVMLEGSLRGFYRSELITVTHVDRLEGWHAIDALCDAGEAVQYKGMWWHPSNLSKYLRLKKEAA